MQLYSKNSIIRSFIVQSFIPDQLKNMLASQTINLSNKTSKNDKLQELYTVNVQYQSTVKQVFKNRKYLYRCIDKINLDIRTSDSFNYQLQNLKCNVHLQQRFRQLYCKKLLQKQNKPKIKTFIIPIYLTLTVDGVSGIQ